MPLQGPSISYLLINCLKLTQYLNMIIKRKSDTLQAKSREKLKPLPHETKALKKSSSTSRMVASSSVRVLKTAHHRIQREQMTPNNENINFLNHQASEPVREKRENYKHQQLCFDEQKQPHTRRLRKSASTGGMKGCKSTRRSLSPALNKQKPDTLRVKYSSKQTSRSEKEKHKPKNPARPERTKSSEKLKNTLMLKYGEQPKKPKSGKTGNKSTRTTRQQSQHLKTEVSSKMPSVSKQIQVKKSKKKNKSKGKQPRPPAKPKVKPSKIQEHFKNSIIFSDVSFQEASPFYSAIARKENFYLGVSDLELDRNLARKIEASITIQRHFRGYLTRKYINELKYMVYCIVKIQKCWRGYLTRKRFKGRVNLNKKNLSIENSLITIKDFSEEQKEEKVRDKHFKFTFEEGEGTRSEEGKSMWSKKKSMNDKCVTLLESLLEEEELEEKIKERIRASLGKSEGSHQHRQDYVKQKINSEIVSQKSFNSPRDMRSPRSGIAMNSPSSWAKNKSFDQNIELCTTPKEIFNTKVLSPAIPRSPPALPALSQNEHIRPFDTSFEFLEQFQMKIIDYMKDNSQELECFLVRCRSCEFLKTNMVLEEWDKFCDDEKLVNDLTPQFAVRESTLSPSIFPPAVRSEIMKQTDMQIYLQERNYSGELWRSDQRQKEAYESMIRSIFDGLTEAIYDEYREESLFKRFKSKSCTLTGYPLFTNILMNSLTRVQGWSEYHCGMEIPVGRQDASYGAYKEKKDERDDMAIRAEVPGFSAGDSSSWALWLEIMMGEMIFQELAEEAEEEVRLF